METMNITAVESAQTTNATTTQPKHRDPEKFCVKRIKYFQSDKAKSKKKRSERKYFYYGESLKRIIKGICEQPEIHKHNRHNEQHEGIVQ